MNKHFLYVVGVPALLVLVVVAAGVYRAQNSVVDEFDVQGLVRTDKASENVPIDAALSEEVASDDALGNPTSRIANPSTPTSPQGGKLAADTFTGTLTKVDTGCFSDGECYVEAGGKHVTAIMGWSQETVGTIQGVPGFGDLESHIGEQVEVYAQRLGEGNYTLYGNTGFYIKVGNGDSSMTSPGNSGDGVNSIAVGEPNPETPRPKATGGCMVGGCSSQLCAEEGSDVVSTCEWRESYACYQTAKCERQASGQCGWTDTPELTQCLISAQGTADTEVQ
jgi:eight-cysteine-cluster-containing protein